MFNVFRSNQQRRLADAFSKLLFEPLGPSLELQDWIAVQSRPMEDWLKRELAKRMGIFAGGRISFPRALVEHLLGRAQENGGNDWGAFGRERLAWSILEVLPALVQKPGFEALLRYVRGDDEDVKFHQLCQKIAGVFDQYAVYRPDMVLGWEKERPVNWQAVLWNALVEREDSVHIAAGAKRYFEAVKRGELDLSPLPRISLFGISTLPPLFVQVLAAAGKITGVNLFVISPCSEFWTHIRTRPGGATVDAGNDVDPDLHRETGNPLLAGMGGIFRDFQGILEDVGNYNETFETLYQEPLEETEPTLLGMVKSDILHLVSRAPGAEVAPLRVSEDDHTIQIHVCSSPMREAEVLHDRLLALFDDSSLALKPEDVLVMVPDIQTYQPFIEAAFAREGEGTPSIPINIRDVNDAMSSEAATLLFSLVELPSSRVAVSDVFAILRLPTVSRHFELAEPEVDLLESWVISSGIRWGVDGAHRKRLGQPEYEENTWRFGLRRLFLGYAMPVSEECVYQGVLPFDEIEGGEAELLGRFASFLEKLFSWVPIAAETRSVNNWSELLSHTLAGLLDPNDLEGTEARVVRDSLKQVSLGATKARYEKPVTLPVMGQALRENLAEKGTSGAGSRGVTFSGAVPMSTLAKKVVCLMGMGYGEFPRSDNSPGFSMLALQPRFGDRSRRGDDRHTFLSALVAADERFILTYTGINEKDGEPMPPSVLVDELLRTVDAGYCQKSVGAPLSERMVTHHPLFPYSPRYFETGDSNLFSYSERYLDMAKALSGGPTKGAPFVTPPLEAVEPRGGGVPISSLVAFFMRPTQYFYEDGLGVKREFEEEIAAEREPLSPEPLDNFVLGTSLVERIRQRADRRDQSGTLYEVKRAKGVLPIGAPGRVRFDSVLQKVSSLVEAAAPPRNGEQLPGLDVALEIGVDGETVCIEGIIDNLYEDRQIVIRYGTLRAPHILALWIRHLVALAVTPSPIRESRLVGFDTNSNVTSVRFSRSDLDPLPLLAGLVDLYQKGRMYPVPLFPDASLAYAKAILKDGSGGNEPAIFDAALDGARKAWEQSFEQKSIAVSRIYGITDPLLQRDSNSIPGFDALSKMVFGPILQNMEVS